MLAFGATSCTFQTQAKAGTGHLAANRSQWSRHEQEVSLATISSIAVSARA